MKKADIKSLEVYFDDPRLKMTIPGRMFVRAGAYVGYLVWIAATGTFILSDLGWLRALGVFFALVLLDRLGPFGSRGSPLLEISHSRRTDIGK